MTDISLNRPDATAIENEYSKNNLDLKNGVTLLTTDFTARSWPGLGFRTALRFEDLDTGNTNTVGPLATTQQAIRAVQDYSDNHQSFNVYCYGDYIGGTEV